MELLQMNELLASEFSNIAKISNRFAEMMLQVSTQDERVQHIKCIRESIKANATTNESNCFLFNASQTQELICMTEIPKTNATMKLFGCNVNLVGATVYIGEDSTQLLCGMRDNGDNAVKSYVWLNMPNPCDGYKVYCAVHFVQSQNCQNTNCQSDATPKDNVDMKGGCAACRTLKRQYETILDELEKINQNLSRRRRFQFVEDTL